MEKEREEYPERVKRARSAEEALSGLMRYAARAERSSGDAMRLMRRWNVPEADRERVLQRLCQAGFIDDRRFAAAYVREKASLAGWGIHKVRAGLRAKGIAPAVAEEALAQEYRAEGMADRLQELLDRKLRGLSGTVYEMKGKLVRFGLSRGYDYDAVVEAALRALQRRGADEEEE